MLLLRRAVCYWPGPKQGLDQQGQGRSIQGQGLTSLPTMCKHDVIHNTGSTQRIAMMPEDDRATAIGNMDEKLVMTGGVVPQIYSRTEFEKTNISTLQIYYVAFEYSQ